MPDSESILGSLTNGQKVIIEDGVAKLPDRSSICRKRSYRRSFGKNHDKYSRHTLIDAIRMITLTPRPHSACGFPKGFFGGR